jgi:DNA repair exonuclease SbcCD ATPase subunit
MQVFDSRTKSVNYSTPDVSGFDWPKLEKVTKDFDRLKADYERTVQTVRELFDSQRSAAEKDNQALAAALREGRADPGTKHADKLAADLKLSERRRDALQLALEQQARTIADTIDTHRGAWQGEVRERIPAAQQELEEAVRRVERARSQLTHLRGLDAWLQKPDQSYTPREAAKNTTLLIKGGINRQGQEPTLASIREEARGA